MATNKQKQELIDILKFTPITVQIMIQGYGGEAYAGTVDRKIYDYFKEHKIDLEEFANDWDDNFEFVPEDMRPFSPGQQYDCDNLWHASGAELDGTNTITVSGPEGDIWEHSLDYSELEESGVDVVEYGGSDLSDDDIPEGKVVYSGGQGEKGCFFDGELTLRAPFDPKKLKISYENCGGWYIVNYVEYDGEEIDGSGGYSTTGKWAENKWVLPGDEEVYESVSIEDREEEDFEEDAGFTAFKDLADNVAEQKSSFDWSPLEEEPKLTEWFNKDIKPSINGEYDVLVEGATWPHSGPRRATWDGKNWKTGILTVKITSWRGLAENPNV